MAKSQDPRLAPDLVRALRPDELAGANPLIEADTVNLTYDVGGGGWSGATPWKQKRDIPVALLPVAWNLRATAPGTLLGGNNLPLPQVDQYMVTDFQAWFFNAGAPNLVFVDLQALDPGGAGLVDFGRYEQQIAGGTRWIINLSGLRWYIPPNWDFHIDVSDSVGLNLTTELSIHVVRSVEGAELPR